ncbi:MAG: nucleotidyl transferase AbiEii/AbiGii toxin family protein [Patescibacteria group bacterium]
MILLNKKDAIHWAWLLRTLSALCDDKFLASVLYFKGGTSATLRGFLDRFSFDLDFDFVGDQKDLPKIRKKMENIFAKLGLEIKDSSKIIPQYFLKYPNKKDERNTLKVEVATWQVKANKYEPVRLVEIDRIITCQSIETMFANKLVAVLDRYEKHHSIAGRDIYDLHHFFINGYEIENGVIEERRSQLNATGSSKKLFFKQLSDFIEKKITQTIIEQDLNVLLSPEKFKQIRGILKLEILRFLKEKR